MKKINLFICGFFLYDDVERLRFGRKKPYNQNAANEFQKKIIDGFYKNDIELKIVSAPFINPFPKNSLLYFRKHKNDKINYVSFLNVWGIRNYSRFRNLKREIEKINLNKYSQVNLYIYSVHTPFVKLGYYLKKKYKNVNVILIAPDLPQYMNCGKQSIVYKIFKKRDIKKFYKYSNKVDYYVLLTDEMNKVINTNNKDYIVIEGIINEDKLKNIFEVVEKNIKSIVYTGTLNESFGVKKLVECFEKNDLDMNLIICGDGELKDYVVKKANINNKIKYLGLLSHEDIIKIQKEATILINPRNCDNDFVKYSFPSKIMEYLISGNRVICYKLPGIPDDYDKFLYYINPDDSNGINEAIRKVVNERFDELIYKEKINLFLQSKTEKESVKKILDMINKGEETNL